ncbi:MAG: beta-galactosidase [Sphingobacteriales bacterium]|nr:MAG: beta-galactosidase [Sphingobacteriales bacterium]
MKLCVLIAILITNFCAITHAQTPINNNYKVEIISPTRAQIVLNNKWLFQPATNKAEQNPVTTAWDTLQVPSSWYSNFTVDSAIKTANNDKQKQLKDLNKAWYQTTVFIPANWKKNATNLQLTKVSTDAVVYINGKKAGQVEWAAGVVDVSKFVQYGKQNEIKILVIATPNQADIPVLMGTATTQVTFTKAVLETRGIIGDVILSSQPKNTFINDVFVQPSVRQSKLGLDVEIVGVNKAGLAAVTAQLFNQKGELEKTFTTTLNLIAKDTQTVKLAFNWANARLWDLDQPNLYTLKLKIEAKNLINDVYAQEFGFREFWIDGKYFYLNGSRINLRPHLFVGGKGMDELIDASIDGIRKNGFNISEIWPNNFDLRGTLEYSEQMMTRADKKGFLLMGVALPFVHYLVDESWGFRWDKPGIKKAFEKRLLLSLRRDRNHPSVVMWTTTGNFFGNIQDQNPVNIGRVNWVKNNPPFQKNAEAGLEAINIIKKHDPTRPVFTHHGTYIGDVHTLNFYLNFTPLQEREEWMSAYAEKGQIPFIGIEFGTPLYCDFLRGRNGFGSNIVSEPLITEFTAAYLGEKAYTNEPLNYKNYIKNNFISGQTYKGMSSSSIINMWSFMQLQKLFTTNTWRSWRTYNLPSTMLPWDDGYGWNRNKSKTSIVNMKPFETGRKGMYYPTASVTDLYEKQQPAYTTTLAGQAFNANNNATLAYIAGAPEAFTEKSHNFKTNQNIQKQLFFFNDTREKQKCTWQYNITVAGKTISKNQGEFVLPVGDNKHEIINFITPTQINGFKADGRIILNAQIGNNLHTDTLNFRVFNIPKIEGNKTLYVLDPVGKTTDMLTTLGYQTQKWDGKTSIPLLIIGRDVISKNFKLPLPLQTFVQNGGKALVFNQQDTVLEKSGFRLSKYVSRYVFPIKNNPITQNLDEEDLRNWAGIGTLNTAYPDYMNKAYEKSPDESPIYGWHWGNRGSVATNAIEKPHNSGWSPLLECEFDMAYSPLMELNYGKGKLIWCSLDVEDNAHLDPVAQTITQQLISYVQTTTPIPRNEKTIFIGNLQESKMLDVVGLDYVSSNTVQVNANLIICGSLNTQQQKDISQYVQNGGKAFILPKAMAGNYLGVDFVLDSTFDGGKTIPNWALTNGLSLSDIRYRTPTPTVKINAGCNIALSGLLGKKQMGKGEIIFCQFDVNRFKADTLTYNRFTTWRQNRAFTQILSNLGASFVCDKNIFVEEEKNLFSIDLDRTTWKAAFTQSLPAVTDILFKHPDPGISPQALKLVATDANESEMINTQVPMSALDKIYTDLQTNDGEVVLRKTIFINDNMFGKDLLLNLAVIDDFDNTFFNGLQVGYTDNKTAETWNFNRTYTIPANLVKKGKNVIAVRLFDWYGGGGMGIGPLKREITLKPEDIKKPIGLYNVDYRSDFDLGDNPFRYFRW